MVVLKVPKMNCDGCAATIGKAITAMDAVAVVTPDLDAKTVTIDTEIEATRISAAVRAAGYENDVLRGT